MLQTMIINSMALLLFHLVQVTREGIPWREEEEGKMVATHLQLQLFFFFNNSFLKLINLAAAHRIFAAVHRLSPVVGA